MARPNTLLLPALGMVSGGLTALGASPRWRSDARTSVAGLFFSILVGVLMASVLNAASNSAGGAAPPQVSYDFAVKHRVLVSLRTSSNRFVVIFDSGRTTKSQRYRRSLGPVRPPVEGEGG
jgi:hypothetical protein